MKIIDVVTFVVGNPWKNWVFLRVLTDEGISGIAEATMGLQTKPIEVAIHELRPLYIGLDPRRIEHLHDAIYKGTFQGAGPVVTTAISALDIACFDILGKSLGVPCHQLLGGKMWDKLRAYANGWYQGPRDPAFFGEKARQVAEMGYTALKFDPFGNAYRFLEPAELRLSLALVRAVRDAVGPDVDILIEGHDRFSVSTAVTIGDALAEFRPMFFETPVLSTDLEATVEVARRIKVPVATGERLNTLEQFARLLALGGVDIVQPETLRCGGFLGVKKVAAIAEAHKAFVALHNAQSPLTTAINAHLDATLPNFLIQECFDDAAVAWAGDLMRGVPRMVDGYLPVPEGPGLGVELNDEEMLKHPYSDRNFLRLFDEGWEQRRSS
ncbi:MAG: mandelate racemase/muconate lactonizing enzyme family protein [Bacteroidetes bacterium]|nr:mandelate racemase/muconate lactonizing enzyme family protein [Bacteroidota bacterium]MCL5024999.1 mandelate racemase/muconate lactonizing enzyme family protein [Chloroflexota bacterium]